jgi:tetratricopeptide (TPR) repeat protein
LSEIGTFRQLRRVACQRSYAFLGQHEKALAENQEAMRLAPDALLSYVNLGESYLNLNRLDEAQATFDKAFAGKLDGGYLRVQV